MSRDMGDCSFDGCERSAEKRVGDELLCETHRKQRLRDGHTRTPRRRHETPWARLTEAALTYADVDSEDDTAFHLARNNLARAARVYVHAIELDGSAPSNVLRFPRSSAPRRSLLAG